MKKLMCVFLVLTILLFSSCTGNTSKTQEGKITIATSFYPVYIFTLNLVNGIDEIKVECMAEQSVGCLHDYTLTARDARLLSDAEALIINGAGMESFLEDAFESVENLKVIDSSENIRLICNEEHNHEGTSQDHNHHENSHIWLSVDNAKIQVENIKNALITEFPEHEAAIEENYKDYITRLNKLIEKRDSISFEGKDVSAISFHGAYEYLSEELGFLIASTIESDEGKEPSAKELAQLTKIIKKDSIRALLIEPDYSGSAAEILSREASIEIYTLNPIVSGEVKLTAYEDAMNKNYDILEAVK